MDAIKELINKKTQIEKIRREIIVNNDHRLEIAHSQGLNDLKQLIYCAKKEIAELEQNIKALTNGTNSIYRISQTNATTSKRVFQKP